MRSCYTVFVLLTLASSAWADTIVLKGHEKPIQGQIVDEQDEVFVLEVRKDQIEKVERSAPFVKRSTVASPRVLLEERDGYLIIQIPQEQVERRSLAASPAPSSSPGADRVPPQAAIAPAAVMSAPAPPLSRTDQRLGSIAGRVLWDGKPLAHCKVKTVMVSSPQPLAMVNKLLGHTEADADEHGYVAEAATDALGRYRIERVPPGEYDLYWQPSEQASSEWIRRLHEKPDLVVLAGEATTHPDIEAHVKTRN